EELSRIDTSLDPVSQTLEQARINIQEASYTLRDYLSRLEDNPARLEDVETRLAALDRLKRKYGGSIEEVLKFLADVRSSIEGLETSDERAAALESQKSALAKEYERISARLTKQRTAAAETLSRRVEDELKPLAMERTVFQVKVAPAE